MNLIQEMNRAKIKIDKKQTFNKAKSTTDTNIEKKAE